MEQAIRDILDQIPSGHVFDSHFVIAQLIKHHSDEYLEFASSIATTTDRTLTVHGRIGLEIAKFQNDTIVRLDHMSWSENIHGNPSDCTGWRKM